MRALFVTLGIVIVLCWLGYESYRTRPRLAAVFFTLAGVFGLLLVGAFFGLY